MGAKRVVVYIDGFNLYYGMRSKGWHRYNWLNVQLLAQNLLKPGQALVGTKYFTSRVSSTPRDPHKNRRQSTYLEALGTLPDVRIFFGHYLENTVTCFRCGAEWPMPEEKMTDVNMAVEMMLDAFQDRWDTALLVSGDSDLTAPIQRIRSLFTGKRIVVAFPPDRTSVQLRKVAHAYLTIGRKKLADSQFPDTVRKADGYTLTRPEEWR
ncbi:MAG: NYN domain-containing protein [Candidatus Bipolaricaulota bacterium]